MASDLCTTPYSPPHIRKGREGRREEGRGGEGRRGEERKGKEGRGEGRGGEEGKRRERGGEGRRVEGRGGEEEKGEGREEGEERGGEGRNTLSALLWTFPRSGNRALARTRSRRVTLGSHVPRTAGENEANKVSRYGASAAIGVKGTSTATPPKGASLTFLYVKWSPFKSSIFCCAFFLRSILCGSDQLRINAKSNPLCGSPHGRDNQLTSVPSLARVKTDLEGMPRKWRRNHRRPAKLANCWIKS